MTGPRSLQRFLLDGERVVVALHRHWAEVAEPVVSCLAGIIAAAWLDTRFGQAAPMVSNVAWLAWFFLLGRALYQLMERRHDWFVATDKRLLLFYGLITQKVAMMPLAKVTDMSYERSPLGRTLGYGEFVLESAGQEQALRNIRWVPEPDRNYRLICAEIFGVPGSANASPEVAADFDEGLGPAQGYAAGPAAAGPRPPRGSGRGSGRGSDGGSVGGSGDGSGGRAGVPGGSGSGSAGAGGRPGRAPGVSGRSGPGPRSSGTYHGPVAGSEHEPSESAPAGANPSRPTTQRGSGPGSNPALDPYDDFAAASAGDPSAWSMAIPVQGAPSSPGEQVYQPPDLRRRSPRDADTGPIPIFRPRPEH